MEQELTDFQLISDSCGHFSSELFKAFIYEKNHENIISSALSTYIILFLLYYGADGITKQELKSTLHLLDPNQLRKELKYLLISLSNYEKDDLQMANAIYVDNNFILLHDFLTETKDNFQTFIEKFNSKNSDDSSQKINTWVKEKTKGKISHIISSDDIDEYTKVILINTLYFKSNWLNPFESKLTIKKKFYNIDNVETYVPTMSKTFQLPHGYIEGLNANFIKLQYLNEKFEMIIILPHEKFGLFELEKNFDWNVVSKASYFTKEVELSLPKFKIEATVDLKTTLKKIGINSIFNKQANFSFMAKAPLNIDQVFQKVFIEVDEKGSEAAVATTVQIRSRRMIIDTENFIVEHPFIFIIHYKPSNIPLFIGSIRKLGNTLKKDEL